jgi:putative peptidoglycan lipid II flippase
VSEPGDRPAAPLRGARTMAVGTAVSRATGFLRTALLVAVLGLEGVMLPFNLANTAPNIILEIVLGGIITSALVPLLVRAQHEGHGEAFAQRLLSLALLGLGGLSVLLVLLAPQIVDVYDGGMSPDDRSLAITFARFFLPQVLFYGLGAIVGAYLNTQGRFGPPMWAPVLNNLVVITTLGVFVLLPGPAALTSATITDTQVLLLGLGVTLGIVAQTVALVPALRATGLRLRLRLDLRGSGLGAVGRLGRWTLVYVLGNQLVLVVVAQLATATGNKRDFPSYTAAFVLWQLPHAVIAVSVITALLPAMSKAAVEQRTADLRRQLDHGLRLTTSVLVPAAVAYLVLGRPIATLVFGHGQTSADDARFVGTMLGLLACGLVAFSSYQLQLRAFYAMQDTRTPALMNLGINATAVAVDVALWLSLPNEHKALGLAAGQATSYLVGAVVCSRVLARRVPTDPAGQVLRTVLRCLLAVSLPALVALAVSLGVQELAGRSPLGSGLAAAAAGLVLVAGYLPLARRLEVREVDELVGPVMSKITGGRSGSSQGLPPPRPQG